MYSEFGGSEFEVRAHRLFFEERGIVQSTFPVLEKMCCESSKSALNFCGILGFRAFVASNRLFYDQ